ncbi:hypothetical protein MPNT_50109 [Candidatus Methylacidithermus pantelleriae]|uniref:Uncharacterized protein n=1 Tax=Candidatus Methylacidithermus pantelleriae TaxID=2744239 RepID=A0A8J2BQ24_9BACT|nr:hypothetical protein MPNT_50109 [Candidatus Methylacidithermus pantelleriae]
MEGSQRGFIGRVSYPKVGAILVKWCNRLMCLGLEYWKAV